MPFDATPVETNTVADVLRRAKALIDSPEKWCQGKHQIEHALCIEAALNVAHFGKPYEGNSCGGEHWTFMHRATKHIQLWRWNDTPGRTHAEVMTAFDKAIELAERGA